MTDYFCVPILLSPLTVSSMDLQPLALAVVSVRG